MNISEEEGASLGKREGTGLRFRRQNGSKRLRCWLEHGENVGRFWYNLSKSFEASHK